MQNDSIVSLKKVFVEYNSSGGKVLAVQNINIEIGEKEFVCILGPSGCGKSTLLNVIAGFIKPTGGIALMHDEEIVGTDWNRGVIFQSPPLYPWLNVHDNIAFGLKRRKLPKNEIEIRVKKYLDLVGLQEFGKFKTYELSGGMRQRVSMARVLVNQPEMILMDEPLGALDAFTKAKMQELLRNIWKKMESTIFYITHDVDEALMLATRIIVMSERPGHVLWDERVGFTYRIAEEGNDEVKYSEEYLKIRREIMRHIIIK